MSIEYAERNKPSFCLIVRTNKSWNGEKKKNTSKLRLLI